MKWKMAEDCESGNFLWIFSTSIEIDSSSASARARFEALPLSRSSCFHSFYAMNNCWLPSTSQSFSPPFNFQFGGILKTQVRAKHLCDFLVAVRVLPKSSQHETLMLYGGNLFESQHLFVLCSRYNKTFKKTFGNLWIPFFMGCVTFTTLTTN